MTGNFYGPASCGWGWGCGLRRFRCECVSFCACVCGETFASNCSILSSVCSELGMCANSLSSASRLFFSLSFLRFFCQQSIWTIDVAISCAQPFRQHPPLSPVPCPCRVSCPCAWPSAKCQVFTPPTVCVCVTVCVCSPPSFETTLWCM